MSETLAKVYLTILGDDAPDTEGNPINKVLKAAHDLGYRLSPREPVLASGDERNLIVYLADEISTSPHPVVNIDGARDAVMGVLGVFSDNLKRMVAGGPISGGLAFRGGRRG